jgi:glycine betaine/proline transport system permease protein
MAGLSERTAVAGPTPDALVTEGGERGVDTSPGSAPLPTSAGAAQPGGRKVSPRTLTFVGVIVLWVIAWAVLKGRWTLALGTADLTSVHEALNDFNAFVGSSRGSSPIFTYFFDPIRTVIDGLTNFLTHTIAKSDVGLGIPTIGWLGVTALATWIAYTIGNWRVALLTALGLVFIGLQGLWVPAMQLLALTLASVLVALVFAIPLGVLAGVNDRFHRFVTPILDFMQTMPSYVYLAPLALFFGIGPAAAVITTVVYAAPPTIRITDHGIRQIPVTTLEAVDSIGVTGAQKLRTVLLPMAKRTIVIGINQTIMAALAMATIAALIAAPGLGQQVLQALQSLDIGKAFNAGLAIVLMAIILDRTTTAASVRAELGARATKPGRQKLRLGIIVGGALVTVAAIVASQQQLWAAVFPKSLTVGPLITNGATEVTGWATTNLSGLTSALQNVVTAGILNPFQSLLADSPWFITGLVILVIAYLLGGLRPLVVTAVCLALILTLGLWSDSMVTLAMTLVATLLVMVLAVVFGTWMGRSQRADAIIRPILDAAQTLPAFVYLVPFIAFFGASRFTAIVAAIVYAAPVAIKIVADGIRGVSPTTMEAATSSGSSTWQLITKVQIPMAAKSLGLATNQGLIYTLSMVVVGGLVGGGALGYLVVAGFVQNQLYGKGLAAGLAIVLLGVMLDRITQSAAAKIGR